MEKLIIDQILQIAEKFFKTEDDPSQIPTNEDALKKMICLSEKSFIYTIRKDGQLAGWITVVPTSQELALEFLNGIITEHELLNLTEPKSHYNAVYLCSAYTIPEERRRGLAVQMFTDALRSIPCFPDPMLLAWPYSTEGGCCIKKLEIVFGKKIHLKV